MQVTASISIVFFLNTPLKSGTCPGTVLAGDHPGNVPEIGGVFHLTDGTQKWQALAMWLVNGPFAFKS